MGFSRQEYWSGLPFPSPGDLPDPGIEPRSPAFQADALPSEPPGKPGQSRLTLNVPSPGLPPLVNSILHLWASRKYFTSSPRPQFELFLDLSRLLQLSSMHVHHWRGTYQILVLCRKKSRLRLAPNCRGLLKHLWPFLLGDPWESKAGQRGRGLPRRPRGRQVLSPVKCGYSSPFGGCSEGRGEGGLGGRPAAASQWLSASLPVAAGRLEAGVHGSRRPWARAILLDWQSAAARIPSPPPSPQLRPSLFGCPCDGRAGKGHWREALWALGGMDGPSRCCVQAKGPNWTSSENLSLPGVGYLHHFLGLVWPWAGSSASLCLECLHCKTGVATIIQYKLMGLWWELKELGRPYCCCCC